MVPFRLIFGPLIALFGAEFNQPRTRGRYRGRQCERGQAREVSVENRTAGIDRSEAVLRWVAVALALALFVGSLACAGEGAEPATAEAVVASGLSSGHGQKVVYPQAAAWRSEAGDVQPDALPVAEPKPSESLERVAEATVAEATVAEATVAEATVAEAPAPEATVAAAPAAEEVQAPWEHYMLGVSAWKEGELGEAELHLREWVAHAPGDAKGRVNLARVLIEIGRPYEAKEHAAIAENLDPASVAAKRIHARALDESGDCSSAIAKYEDALWINPEDYWSLNNLGYLLIRHGRFEDAIGPLALAVQLDSTNLMFRTNLGAALRGAGHRFAALETLDAAPLADKFRRELLGTPRANDLLIAECSP